MLPVEQPIKTYTGLDGKPLENGYVYFGQPDLNPITNPVTVYWDAEGTIPAAQPIRTVGGYIVRAGTPANVYFEGAYSQLVLDSKKRQVFIAPNSTSFAVSSAVAGLFSESGSALVGFAQEGAGETARSVQDRLRDTVNIKDFGAKGDGVTDDTLAIQRAHNASRCVYYPFTANGYRVTGTITIAQENTTIHGDAGSNFASYINLENHNFDVFNVTAASGFDVHNLAILNFGTKTPGKWAFRFDDTSSVSMRAVRVYGCHSGILLGKDGSVAGGSHSRLQNIDILKLGSGGGVGIYKGGSAEILEILDALISGPGTGAGGVDNAFAGVQLRQGAATVMRNLELIGCGKPVYVNPPAGKSVVHTTLHNIWCDSSSDTGLALDGSAGQIIDFRVADSWASSCTTGVRITGFVRGLKLGGMEIITNRADGITIDDNADVAGLAIYYSEIAGNLGTGISVGKNVSGFDISHNVIGGGSHFGANASGVFLGTGVDQYRVAFNDIRGNTGGSIVGHSGKTLSRVVSDNTGFVTYNSKGDAGLTDAAGLLTFAHGLFKTPSDVRITIFGGAVMTPLVCHVVSIDSTNVQMRVFAGTAPLASSNVNFYWEAAA